MKIFNFVWSLQSLPEKRSFKKLLKILKSAEKPEAKFGVILPLKLSTLATKYFRETDFIPLVLQHETFPYVVFNVCLLLCFSFVFCQ